MTSETTLPKITVILCTHNRVQSLALALKSIATQILPQSVDWEILVVDNNSSDETRQIVEDLARRYPRIQYLFESKQGISQARNLGIRHARGEILAFIDDDETASSDWLWNLTANLDSSEWSGAGGRVVAKWSCSRPRWLSDQSHLTSAPLAMFDRGTEAGELNDVAGANMAFRKEVFDVHGGFRTDLGRVGTGLLSGEESEFCRRIIASGRRLRYEPSAVTYHPVGESRVRQKYFLEWWFNKGRSDVVEFGAQANHMPVFGVPLRLFRGLIANSLRWMVTVEPSQRFICKLKTWACAGQISEHYHQTFKKKIRAQRSSNLSPPADGS